MPGGWPLRAAWLAGGFPQSVLAVRPAQHRPRNVRHDRPCATPGILHRTGSRAAGPDFPGPPPTSDTTARASSARSSPDRRFPGAAAGTPARTPAWQSTMSNGAVSRGHASGRIRPPNVTPRCWLRSPAARLYRHGSPAPGQAAPPEVRAAFTALARFAEFSGTGAQTTYSFGRTAVSFLPAPPKEPSEEITTAPGDRPL